MKTKNYFLILAICFYIISLCMLVPFLAYLTKFTAYMIICPAALILAITFTVVYVKLRKKEKNNTTAANDYQPKPHKKTSDYEGTQLNSKKEFYINLAFIIASPVFIVAGVLVVILSKSTLGWVLILLGVYFFLMWGIRALAMRSIKKEKAKEAAKKELAKDDDVDKSLDEALKAFEDVTDYPETNTVKLVGEGLEFFAEGRFVCEKDFKNVRGYHLAFEINTTALKFMPDGYDDVCDYEGVGVLIAVGYHDGEALEKYANDNGVILREPPENSVGKTITLRHDDGYSFYVQTVEFDDASFGFVKILKCENGVLTVYFTVDVPFGLNGIVEGTVELKMETDENTRDIHSLISKIKRKQYNTIDVSDEEIGAIKQANPFLPESYITFLEEVGFADLDWIDVGRNTKTPTNLYDDETGYIKDILAAHKELNVDDFYFIAIVSDGGYYAFSKNPDDKKVYSFSDDAAGIATEESFEEFLYNILNV